MAFPPTADVLHPAGAGKVCAQASDAAQNVKREKTAMGSSNPADMWNKLRCPEAVVAVHCIEALPWGRRDMAESTYLYRLDYTAVDENFSRLPLLSIGYLQKV